MESVNTSSIQAILVTLKIGEEQSLFILLAADGTINRMGNGSERIECDLFIGKTSRDAFQAALGHAQPVFDEWLGGFVDPNPGGKVCQLQVGFQSSDGREHMSQWEYGSRSQGPPPEVTGLVIAAVEATEPWFAEQKQMADNNAK